jgi:hypothetical protein
MLVVTSFVFCYPHYFILCINSFIMDVDHSQSIVHKTECGLSFVVLKDIC